ncbi:hypothetical protein PENSPDRAFT_576632 [Peniophora sp. CONT]|nr:hypothetical protein PENSPDRAFT_576632 [Peniophora sp. CONT]
MAPKTKAAPANGTKSAPKESAPKPSASPAPADGGADAVLADADGPITKPDKAAYDAEQDRLRKEIEVQQAKLSAIKEKIGFSGKGGAGNDRRNQLRAELDQLRSQQAGGKQSRGKIFDELKVVQERVQTKVKTLNASRGKVAFKSVADVDAHIKHLEKQVESGSMKLADEKRALQEISQTKRARKTVEGFQAEEDAIAADRATIEDLKKQLDDPELKAASDRFDAIRTELDALRKEGDEAWGNRNKLFDERNAIQVELDSLFGQKRESAAAYRAAGDRYWTKVNEDRARRAERARTQRQAEEEEKKRETASRLLEEASEPAFQYQIEDCQTLIDYFSGGASGAPPKLSTDAKADEPKHDLRVVEAPQEGITVLKKKGADEEVFFAGKGKKGKKGGNKAAAPPDDKDKLNVPFATLSALLTLSIPPPVNNGDVPRVIEDLKTKKAWFEANQTRVTQEAIAKAKAAVERLNKGQDPVATEPAPPNGNGERPAEPAPTPSAKDAPKSITPPSDVVDEKLEEVKEELEAVAE